MNTTKKYIVMKSYGSKIEMDSEHDSIKSARNRQKQLKGYRTWVEHYSIMKNSEKRILGKLY